jgi:hypothetical protein
MLCGGPENPMVVNGTGLKDLIGLKELVALDLSYAQIGVDSNGVDALCDLKQLRRLKLDHNPMNAALENLILPPRRPALREKHAEVLSYLKNNVHRMDYPTYQAKGWLIGSGAVESACKTVVGQRLKLAGMRWREHGTDTVCHLRALYKSEPGQWSAFWERSLN